MSTAHPAPRAEHRSLTEYLRRTLNEDELEHIGLLSFNQWTFTTAALADVALATHSMGKAVTIGFWADATPVPDPGWTSSRRLARFFRSRTKDQNAEAGLRAAGLPPSSFAKPPLRRWKPRSLPPIPDPLTRSSIRKLVYDESGMGRSILQVHPDFDTPVRDDYLWPGRWVKAAIRSYAWVYDQTTALIRTRGITTLMVYNGRFTHDRAAAAAAERLGVRVLYYDAGGLDNAYDLTTATTHDWHHLQERMFIMWDNWDEPEGSESRESLGRAWFENRRAHDEPGLEVFVEHQERGYLPDLPRAEQLVVFFSSSGDEIAELDLDWEQYLHSQEQALAALAEACRRRPGTKLVVRTHPHMRLKPSDDLRDWRAAVEAATPDAHFDAGSPVDSYALMRAADIVFTYGSTAGIEAAYANRPVVVMGPSAYDILGCAQRVTSPEQVAQALDQPPATNPEAALKYGLMMQRRGFNFEFVQAPPGGEPRVGGVPLNDASNVTKKLSHAWLQRRTAWLTGK